MSTAEAGAIPGETRPSFALALLILDNRQGRFNLHSCARLLILLLPRPFRGRIRRISPELANPSLRGIARVAVPG